jgi:DNA-binding transcriptional ArsR family regulator
LAAIVDQPDDLRALRDFHKTLADVNRLRIIRRLAMSPATVTDLIANVGLSQPLVSWHLGKLRLAGLVETRRNGRETICRLRADAFAVFATHERRALGLDGIVSGRDEALAAPIDDVAARETRGAAAEAAS